MLVYSDRGMSLTAVLNMISNSITLLPSGSESGRQSGMDSFMEVHNVSPFVGGFRVNFSLNRQVCPSLGVHLFFFLAGYNVSWNN